MHAERNANTPARRRDLLAWGYTSRSIASALELGTLERLSRGLYRLTAAVDGITEKHTYVQVAKLAPQGVYCLISALAFHELTVENNWKMQIALPRPAHEPKVDFAPVEYFHLSDEPFRTGIEVHQVEGTTVKVYSPAKTVADLFKFRNRHGVDLAVEALREVWRKRRASASELYKCAKVCRVERVMRPYLEAVIW